MSNDKGFVTLGIIISVLIISLTLVGLFYKPMINTTSHVKMSENILRDYTKSINSKERLYSILKENVSYQGNTNFEDLENSYEISISKENYESIELDFDAQQQNSFQINNKTDIKLFFEMVGPLNPVEPYSYDVDLKVNDVDVLNGLNKDGLTNDTIIEIDDNFVYNEKENKVNYGEYKLTINANNCYVTAKVKFDKLKYREISMLNKDLKKKIAINNENDNVNIYFVD